MATGLQAALATLREMKILDGSSWRLERGWWPTHVWTNEYEPVGAIGEARWRETHKEFCIVR